MTHSIQEVPKDLAAARRVHHLWMELDAVHTTAIRERRHWRVSAGSQSVEARWQLRDMVAVAHPHGKLRVQALEETVRLADRQQRGTVLACVTGIDLAPEVMSDQLHAVADAEHRYTGAEGVRIHLGRARLVNARRAAGEDQPGRGSAPELGPGRGAGNQLAVDAGFTDPARDELAVLGPEVEDENCLPAARTRPFPLCLRDGRARDQLSLSPCQRVERSASSCLRM